MSVLLKDVSLQKIRDIKRAMRIYTDQSVYDAALDRLRYVFSEFDNIVVDFSGGKDSTVVLNLALDLLGSMERLPCPVLFIDEEANFDCVIDYVDRVMRDPRIKPYWLQIPLRSFNATSNTDRFLKC